MRRLVFSTVTVVTLVAALMMPNTGVAQRVRDVDDIRKDGWHTGEEGMLDVNVEFSGSFGETITDSEGTAYHVWGCSIFEDKVYPPEYWGVFPLYFYDTLVGITVTLQNNSETDNADVRIKTECYTLRTDGSNGAELAAPTQTDTEILPGESVTLDGSFTAAYVEGADSGLDRFLVKVFRVEKDEEPEPELHTITGEINLNPNNSEDNEFLLMVPVAMPPWDGNTPPPPPDFEFITRDDLHQDFPGYEGPGLSTYFKPKGNGNQNGLTVDGQTYPLVNANTYYISSSSMTVNLYNDNINPAGEAVGAWWLGVDATDANLIILDEIVGGTGGEGEGDEETLLMVEEAVFCPPEYNGELTQAVDGLLGD
jgi:hypothetical protein